MSKINYFLKQKMKNIIFINTRSFYPFMNHFNVIFIYILFHFSLPNMALKIHLNKRRLDYLEMHNKEPRGRICIWGARLHSFGHNIYTSPSLLQPFDSGQPWPPAIPPPFYFHFPFSKFEVGNGRKWGKEDERIKIKLFWG